MPVIQMIMFVFFFGLCVGSFLNVCIYRVPADKSIVQPRSMCLSCGYMIPFYDNIPILSYLALGGKCRQCNTAFSIRYPLVEFMCGLFAVCVWLKFGPTPSALIYYALIACLVVITYIDIDHQIIPDIISLPGILVFFLAAFMIPEITWKDSLAGFLAGGGSLYAVAFTYHLLTGKEGMGGGDIKLLAMMGTLIGWKGVGFTIFISSAVGTVAGLIVMIHTGKNMKLAVPFGPFLAIGGIVYLFFGPELINWYITMFASPQY